jgi:DNA repair protein RecN (Recombination protein N)
MLKRLFVRNFVLVTEIDLDLSSGFTVLTGETGAGKSMLVDAISLLLGERASAELVRAGASQAEVAAEFNASQPVVQWLRDNGFDDDGLLLRRTLDKQGKSRGYINGSPATAGQLRELGEQLVDILGQHGHQALMRRDGIRDVLDAFAGANLLAYSQAYDAWQAAERRFADAKSTQATITRERERLSDELHDLDKLAPAEHEWDELSNTQSRLSHSAELIDAAQAVAGQLTENDEALSSQLGTLIHRLESAERLDSSLQDPRIALQGALAQVQDAGHALTSYLGRLDLDPAELARVDARMSAWMQLARRHRVHAAELPALVQTKRQELLALDQLQDMDALAALRDTAHRTCKQLADELTAKRRTAAAQLSKNVTKVMEQLGMPGGVLRAEVTTTQALHSHGQDEIEFLVSGHDGVEPRPIHKIASGGELSRIALAIAVTGRAQSSAPTMVFDEVDAGVGGVTAESVGRLMKQLSDKAQVLCVTHLAQVAAFADQHYQVTKQAGKSGATSHIALLSAEDRVAEVSRMLGASSDNAAALKTARELAKQLIKAADTV